MSQTKTAGNAVAVEYQDLEFNPDYRIGSDGTVWSRAKPGPGSKSHHDWKLIGTNGLVPITLWDGTRKSFTVAYLVLRAFRGTEYGKNRPLHLNGNTSDNRLENLVWTTHAEVLRQRRNTSRGERNAQSKLTDEKVRAIKERLAFGESLSSIARDYAVDPTTILSIRNGRTWKHVSVN